VRMTPDEIMQRWAELPADREIVVYCTCPNEATAAKVAGELRKLGVVRVRPLAGGLAEWERLGFPVDRHFGDDGQPLAMAEAS
jgi:rhodanese-related sulfurtransferase